MGRRHQCTYLANRLKKNRNRTKESNVEHGQLKINVSKVPEAFGYVLMAGVTDAFATAHALQSSGGDVRERRESCSYQFRIEHTEGCCRSGEILRVQILAHHVDVRFFLHFERRERSKLNLISRE